MKRQQNRPLFYLQTLKRTMIRTTSPNHGISYKKRTTAINLRRISHISLVFANQNSNNQFYFGLLPRKRQRTSIKRWQKEHDERETSKNARDHRSTAGHGWDRCTRILCRMACGAPCFRALGVSLHSRWAHTGLQKGNNCFRKGVLHWMVRRFGETKGNCQPCDPSNPHSPSAQEADGR
jgi:hypothetical protein